MICCNRLITHSHLTQADLAGRGRPAGMAGGAAGYPSAPLVRWLGGVGAWGRYFVVLGVHSGPAR